SRMAVQLGGLLRVNLVRCVDDVAVNDELADVVQVAGDGDSFDLLLAPTHLARDDFAVLADALGVPLRVLVLAVNRRGEGAHGVLVDALQAVVEPPVLFGAALDLAQQAVVVQADADVSAERAYELAVFRVELLAAGLPAEQDHADQLAVNGQRRDDLGRDAA